MIAPAIRGILVVGLFVLASTVTNLMPDGVAAADLDGNGGIELITADGRFVEVLTNDHHGQFTLAASLYSGFYPYTVVAADFNGDGALDLIGGNFESVPTLITNNGNGGMIFAGYLPWIIRPDIMQAADVSGDGRIDWIVGGATGIVALTNHGTGQFTLATSNALNCSALEVADIDGDGSVDLIVADKFANRLTVLFNDGRGQFTKSAALNVGSGPGAVLAADVNGDGRFELISANAYDNTLSVVLHYSQLSLSVERTPTNTIVLSWPLTVPPWRLETTTNLFPRPLLWTPVPSPFVTNGATVQALLTATAGQQFFQLRN